jgi:hypothetical protein
MANTTKLGLYLPVGSDLADVETSLRTQLQSIDDKIPVHVCTQATLPVTNLWIGKLVWLTDLNELWFYSSTGWKFILSRSSAWGRKAFSVNNAVGPTVSRNEEKGPYLSCTFNQIQGRLYRIGYSVETDSPNSTDFGNQIRIRYKYDSSVSVSDSLLYSMWADQNKNGSTSSVGHSSTFTYTAGQTRQVTFGLFLYRNDQGSEQVFLGGGNYNSLFAEDVGWR